MRSRAWTTTATIVAAATMLGGAVATAQGDEPVTLEVTSWRTDDLAMWQDQIIPAFEASHPNIKVEFKPVETRTYNAAVDAAFQGGTAADVIACQPYEVTRDNIRKGYYTPIDDLEGLKQFEEDRLEAWSVFDGHTYCMPIAAIHGNIYYNKGIFDELGLAIPTTWDEYMQVLKAVKDSGKYEAIANGSGEGWALSGAGIDHIGGNFWGCDAGRQGLLDGTKKLTDPDFVAAFDAWGDIRPYLPSGYQSLMYPDQQQLFALGRAATWITGSWEINMATSGGVDAGVFAPPLSAPGADLCVMVHPDLAMGVNANGKHQEEAKQFVDWLASDEFLGILTNALPGFFSMRNDAPPITNPLAQQMMDIANSAQGWTPRLALDRLSAGTPSLEVEKQAALQEFWNTPEMTGTDIATKLQTVLEAGYTPPAQ